MYHRVINFIISPSSNSVETLVQMIDCGMNICRLNFSHGDHNVILIYIRVIEKCLI